MRLRFKATHVVLAMLCVMYFITYVDRVNIGTAASEIQKELGLSKLAGKVFRIGHLGECNELTLIGALSGVEMGLSAAGVPHRAGGVEAAMKSLEERTKSNSPGHLKEVGV